ncbi:gustatory receptor 5a for trehalose-like [Aethina tumida]|uniref:gustatory receptor 5a for trehalose-like n=1 Tax=Aethina tumida TaxID=116153 RepID=UPI00214979F6|nr:gustatory receptor 5a for trehalose-like [Aethina tumida]
MEEWSCIERQMKNCRWIIHLQKDTKRLLIISTIFATLEHILAKILGLISVMECDGFEYINLASFFKYLPQSSAFNIFRRGILSDIINLIVDTQLTFSWTFVHVFLIIMCKAMTNVLKQVTEKIKNAAKAEIEAEHVWRTLREDYNRVSRLCRVMNNKLDLLVLFSFSTNLIFILLQLFNSLRPMKNNLERVYFYYSFAFVILRAVFVCLYGAEIYEEGRRPLEVLNKVSDKIYNQEIERLILQIGTTDIALTGRSFFIVTKSLILKIAGAIVSYELVLIQFNEDFLKNISDKSVVCST